MPVLIAISPKLAIREFELNGTLSIGRHESNQIQLSEEKASRMHCRVRLERGQAVIEDLDSANGTFVNGLKVASQALKHNDRITIGATTIIFCEDDTPEKLDETQVLMEGISSKLEAVIADQPIKRRADAARERIRRGAAVGPALPAAPAARLPARRGENHHGAAFLLCFVGVCAAGYFYWRSQQRSDNDEANNTRTRSSTARRATVAAYTPPATPRESQPAPRDTNAQSKTDTSGNSLDDQFKKALAIRDRALASGNILGAKSALQNFLAAIPTDQAGAEPARRAKSELDDTAKVANSALELTLKQAREALQAQRFRVVFQRCTNLISNDPHGPFGAQAREILEKIDERTAAVAEAAKTKAMEAINRGQLGEARAALDSVLGDLTGTRWAGDVSTLLLQAIVAAGYLEEAEAARAKKAAAGEKIPFVAATKKIEGTLAKLDGLTAHLNVGDAGEAELAVSLKAVEPKDFIATLDALELSNRHAELACLWQLLGRKEAARAASDAALKDPGRSPPAVVLAGVLGNAKNLHVFDFSDWRQQTHWEALSGSWLTQDGKYVLESKDGGETFLKPESVGGPFLLEKARLGFEIEIAERAEGWFVLCEFGTEKQGAVISFEGSEVTLQDKIGAKSTGAKLSEGKTISLRVDLAIDGDDATLRLNGQPAAKLTIQGLSKLKGKLSFQARQCLCTLDNVILRSEQ